ncbi:MAG: glycosyltransferase [Eubacterium sp.]|nr:glycosyltransferase [Eubacterium sp.]
MKISVALAYYNGGKYIEKQIYSILGQLGPEDELVLSVDGAKDGSMDLLHRLAREDGRILLTDGPGQGVVRNFEHAITACSGEVIFLSDQDDIWKENKVERVMKVFRDKDVDVVLHNAELMDGDNVIQCGATMFDYRASRTGLLKNFMKNSYVGCCMAFRSRIKDVILPIPRDMYMHDYWIGTAGEKLGGTGLLKECLISYRRHEDNVTDMTHGSLFFMIKKRFNILKCLMILNRRVRAVKAGK